MRYVTFLAGARVRWGRIEGDQVVPLDEVHSSLKSAIAAGVIPTTPANIATSERYDLANLQLLPPIPDPGKILCVGLNYEDHRRETGRAQADQPTIFVRFADTQIGHGAAIVRPLESVALDYEGELAIVIARGGRRIRAAAALDHVAGFSCYNDASIRDWQSHTTQFTPGKNFPASGAFGPWLVTPDEFGRLGPQRLRTRLNGVLMQEAALDDMIFPIERLIEYCSTFTPLSAGDVIVTGTPGGVGAKRDPQVFMKPGDLVEVEIDGIGRLANGIADERGTAGAGRERPCS